ncbi:hypothetical protein OE766_14900 [Pararhizobium sp. YC-54]|uniref:hypothetical protein n=1 Tax=Pararhizobium sp. YC-54 TaxID=2986920 RepID=UPI0021F76E52|nr:hypothetical protein [Pararhizobium sp. YC-54]MCV9999530.1 hypothetical protein [Pararhizobium sp. YC-54]
MWKSQSENEMLSMNSQPDDEGNGAVLAHNGAVLAHTVFNLIICAVLPSLMIWSVIILVFVFADYAFAIAFTLVAASSGLVGWWSRGLLQ